MARALAGSEPPVASVVFEGIEADDRWPEWLAAGWPSSRPPRLRTDLVMDAPEITLGGDYDGWMAARERKFRKEARRTARRLEEEGVTTRVALDDEAIDALLTLHHARWEERGGSNVGEEARRVIVAAAEQMRQLGGEGRLAVALLEGPDGPVAAELTVRAGDRLVFWSGGFDPAWARHAPGTQALLSALTAAAGEGVAVADLGGGAHDYKRKLADGSRPIAWRTLFPRGRRYPLIRLRLARKHARIALRSAIRRLPQERQQQLRALAQRARRGR
jgi:CelD/BcsL family acetyltransferase involved in cellulose biosynthesis